MVETDEIKPPLDCGLLNVIGVIQSWFWSWYNSRECFIFFLFMLVSVHPYCYAIWNYHEPSASPMGQTPLQVSNASGKPIIPEEGTKAFFPAMQGNNTLNYRQACAVESLALLNPELPVYVLFTDENFDNSTETLRTLLRYKNIHLVRINLDDYVSGTPLKSWNRDSGWKKGPNRFVPLNDVLRLLTLSKYGGYFFDLDMLFAKPVKYYRNFIAMEGDDAAVMVGAMHVERGHPLVYMAVMEFLKIYSLDASSYNRSELFNRMLKEWCGVEKLSEMTYAKCKGFSILPESSLYPVRSADWQEYFKQRNASDTGKPDLLTDNVIGLHDANKTSVDEPVIKSSTENYTQLAKENCPLIFSVAPATF